MKSRMIIRGILLIALSLIYVFTFVLIDIEPVRNLQEAVLCGDEEELIRDEQVSTTEAGTTDIVLSCRNIRTGEYRDRSDTASAIVGIGFILMFIPGLLTLILSGAVMSDHEKYVIQSRMLNDPEFRESMDELLRYVRQGKARDSSRPPEFYSKFEMETRLDYAQQLLERGDITSMEYHGLEEEIRRRGSG